MCENLSFIKFVIIRGITSGVVKKIRQSWNAIIDQLLVMRGMIKVGKVYDVTINDLKKRIQNW
jgi:hypothetical protein